MRLLHLSDLHIGKQVNEFPMLEDQKFILEQILDIIRTQKVDALLIAGDIYDRSAPSAEAVAVVDWFLSAVSETGAACFAISGNHDSAERVAYASSILAKHRIYLSPVYDGSIACHTLQDEFGDVNFWLLPFLKPAHVRPFFPETVIEDYTDAMRCVIDACNIDPSKRNVVLAHQFVTHPGIETGRTDSELNLGGLDNVDASVFDPFDYAALGHVHRPQYIGRKSVRYSGSPLKYSASEINYPKSAPLITLGEKGAVSVKTCELHPLHDMREIKGPIEELISKETVEPLSEQERSDYVHVILTDEFTPIDALSKLRAVYPNVMSVSYENNRTAASGSSDSVDVQEYAKLDPFEMFARFYQEQNGGELTDRQAEMARTAFEESEEM